MAQPTTIKGGKVILLLGNGASPEVFSAPCGFDQRSVTFVKATNSVSIPDCDNPDMAPWLAEDATSFSIAISGQGVLAEESLTAWLTAWENSNSINVKMEIVLSSITHTWTGAAQIDNIAIVAKNAERVTITVSIKSDGQWTRVSA